MTKKITDFRPQISNPNKHNTFGLRLLEKSIQEDGWIGSQTAAADGEIIAGSARQEIAIEKFHDGDGNEVEPIVVESDGSRPVIVVRTDIKNANTARARRLSTADNAVANANYDPDFALLQDWSKDDGGIRELFSEKEWREGTGETPKVVDAEAQNINEQWMILIECDGESTQTELLERLSAEGIEMPSVNIVRESSVIRTPRVMQLEGIFDVPPSQKSAETWMVNFDLPTDWNVGLIVGASGSGKTTVARELFGDNIVSGFEWSNDKSLLDDFPKEMSIKDICNLLSSVAFSSPPSWVRPFRVLSNGEQFRVNMARVLAESKELAVMDEFTSVVDRTVAKIGSAAIAKTVRKRNQKFIAVSCHYDIAEWLEPDWIYQPATNEFASGRYLRRPEIHLEVKRVHSSAWQLFRKHHYLNTSLNTSAVCFCAFWDGVPVAFTAVLHFPHPKRKNTKREHRTVCLPDFQGVGIGNAMSDYVGSLCRGLGYSYLSQTSHPAMIRARNASKNWSMIAKPNNTTKAMPKNESLVARDAQPVIQTRIRATFEYIGALLPKDEAAKVWNL